MNWIADLKPGDVIVTGESERLEMVHEVQFASTALDRVYTALTDESIPRYDASNLHQIKRPATPEEEQRFERLREIHAIDWQTCTTETLRAVLAIYEGTLK